MLEPVIGPRPAGVISDDTIFDFGVRALFNAGYEFGWVGESGEFHAWLAAGEASTQAALADGQAFIPAVRDTESGVVIRAGTQGGLIPLDTLAVGGARGSTAGPVSSRWIARFARTPVWAALDATEYPKLAPAGSGFRVVRLPR